MTESTLQNNNLFFRQLIFLTILFGLGITIFVKLSFFVGAFLGAITLYVLLRNLMFGLTEKMGWRSWLAALVIVFVTTLIFFGLGFLLFEVTASKINQTNLTETIDLLSALSENMSRKLGIELGINNIFNQTSDFIGKIVSAIFNSAYSFVINVLLMLIILYSMFIGGRDMEKIAIKYIPFRGENRDKIKLAIKNTIFSTSVVIPIAMITEGSATYLMFWLTGVSNPEFWALLSTLAGLIPLLGSMIVTVPIGIHLISTGQVTTGILVIFLGVLVIANISTVIRAMVLNKTEHTHPLVVLFGVMAGISIFGFWGIIFGPLLIAGFLLLVKIYYGEYKLVNDDFVEPIDQSSATEEV